MFLNTNAHTSEPAGRRVSSFAILAALSMGANAQFKMTGLSYRNSTAVGVSAFSLEGGAPIFVRTDGGLDMMPAMNLLTAESQNIPGAKFALRPVNDDEAFASNTMAGMLGYTVPSASEIFSTPTTTRTYWDFNGSTLPFAGASPVAGGTNLVNFEISAQVGQDTLACGTKWNQCRIRYDEVYTPMFIDTVPSNVAWGMTINFVMNPNRCHNDISVDYDPFYYLKIGTTLTDWEGLIDSSTRLPNWVTGSVKTVVGKNPPARDAKPDINFSKFGKPRLLSSSRHCSFDGSDCWTIRVHPKIDSVSASSGYLSGGQSVTIKGWGLKGKTSTVVQFDGVECAIDKLLSNDEQIICMTGIASKASYQGPQPGQPGITHKFVNPTDAAVTPDWTNYSTFPSTVDQWTSMDTMWNAFDEKSMHVLDGWFKAPKSGNYRFYMAADDQYKLFLDSSNPFDPVTPVATTLVEIGDQTWFKGWRQYYHNNPATHYQGKIVTDWIALVAGKFYKLRGQHKDSGGDSWATVSVEYQPTDSSDVSTNPNAAKAVQSWRIEQTNTAEKWTVTVQNPTAGQYYKISFLYPGTTTSWLSGAIECKAAAWQFRSAIVGFFSDGTRAGSDIQVTLVMYDSAGVVTTSTTAAKKYIYTIMLKKRINGYSFSSAVVATVGTITSTVSVQAPQAPGGVASTAPLAGNFIISCADPNGAISKSKPISIKDWDEGIRIALLDMQYLRGRVKIYDTWTGDESTAWAYSYRENGKSLVVVFEGFNFNPPLCTLENDPLVPVTGNAPKFVTEVLRPFGKTLMFEPVGLEFLYTDAQTAQVRVDVDGIPALCPKLNCGYSYIAATAEIASQTYDANTKLLTVTATAGKDLPTTGILSISFGGIGCATGTESFSATTISCTLTNQPRAGNHKAEIRNAQGFLPYAAGVADITVALVVSSVTPDAANALGGDTLTITGSGFPIDKLQVVVTLVDADNKETKCPVETVSETQIKCKVDKMSNENGVRRNVKVSIQNTRFITRRRELQVTQGVTDSSGTVGQTTGLPYITTINGLTSLDLCPITKQPLVLALSGYTQTLVASDIKVQVRNDNLNPPYARDLYVMSVDDTAKTFTVKFNGAPPNDYYISVTSSFYGRLSTSAITTFKTSSTITGITTPEGPASDGTIGGSWLGGTLVTITGTNFSPAAGDMSVKVGAIWCDIQGAVTATQIVCRIRKTGFSGPSTENVYVYLAASFESKCMPTWDSCKFSYRTPKSSVSSLSESFDATTNSAIVTANGSGLPTNVNGLEFFIDGVKQTTRTATTTQAVFSINGLKQGTSSNIALYVADGLPQNFDTITSITFTPKFVSVSPNSGGSAGGTLLTVRGTGFGINTTGLGLKNTAAMCKEVKVTGWGVFTCLTNPGEVLSTQTLSMTIGTVSYACANTDPNLCKFSALNASSPNVSAVSLSGNTLTYTGTNFPDQASFTATAIFKAAQVDVTTWSATSLVATFPNGLPVALSTEAAVPVIRFTRTSDSVQFFTTKSAGVSLTVAATTPSSSVVTSSFAGGFPYVITGNTAFATLSEPGNQVTICGNVCKLDTFASDATKATCITPPLATTYSATNLKITESKLISGVWTGSVPGEETKVTDGVWPSEYKDTAINPWIEIDFPDTQVGVLDSAKILINNLDTAKVPFAGATKLQGYDGTAYVDILTLDATIHEGWNVFTWDTNKPSYQKYRWQGTTAGSVRFGEVKFFGIVAVNDNNPSISCQAKMWINGVATNLASVTYDNAATASVTSITPRFGKVQGGEEITIVGTNFVSGSTHVTIDGINCVIGTVTSTEIKCTTGSRPGDQPNPSFVIKVDGKGFAANMGKTFRYVSYWSNPLTWGNDAPPQFGEAIQIPAGRTLFVDVDSVPQLSFIVVEGALIFAPHPTDLTHHRKFDAGYIFINNGYMEAGTEEFPYTSRLTITMHGDVTTPAIPTYGNKNIAVRKGQLHLVGAPKPVTWTMLDSTVLAGADTITLLPQPVGFNWAVGDEIVIASTDYDHKHSETAFITQITTVSGKPVLKLDRKLVYKHYAALYAVGSDSIEMRAEVGLLTRTVKYQGDPETSPVNKYGAHIMIHYPEDESCIGRILYTEFFNVGQAFKLGRYPIHFHVIGTVAKSLVKGNAIHQTYNRAVTIHAVSYFTIENNVVYNAMGHNIFIEDAIETKNVIKNNLVVSTVRSWSLLNTDQTPASFWITHPDNIFIGNHAAGSDSYGYWFDTQETSINGSFNPQICPKNEKLGEFRDNETHSNERYGLRLFHKLVPRQRPCDPWIFNADMSLPNAPYPDNPAIPARFYNLKSWKNGRAGAIAEEMGAVEWHGFKVADNILAGMEWSFADQQVLKKDIMLIKDALVIGKTDNVEQAMLDGPGARGIIGPRWDYFTVRNVKFYNYDYGTWGALGDCSHCFHPASTDSGARTYFTSGLTFDTSVPKKMWYQYPWRGIWHDEDGSLTGMGAGSWATPYFLHNEQPECVKDTAVFDGLRCDNTAQVRRVVFHNIDPTSFEMMDLKIAKYDPDKMALQTNLTAYQLDTTNYGAVFYKSKKNPLKSWAVPFVTGHTYRTYWDIGQLNWNRMQIEVGNPWLDTDKYVYINFPYTENYEVIETFNHYGGSFAAEQGKSTYYAPNILATTPIANQLSGMSKFDMVKKEWDLVINGKDASSKQLEARTTRCRAFEAKWCVAATVVTECTGTPLLWSNPASWPNGKLPVDGESILIPSGKTFVFDLAQSPKLNLIEIVGCLEFLGDNSIDQTLHAHQIFVRGGKLQIGSLLTPYSKKATIILYGVYNDQFITMPGAIEAGNKMIANVGTVKMIGRARSRMARLTSVANKGTSSVTVDLGLDWVAGDEIGFAPTASQWNHWEQAIIASYNPATGALTTTTPLQFYHFGASVSTAANYQGVDMRGEVILLTRNILIKGDVTAENTWNGHFLTMDSFQLDTSGNRITYAGKTILQNVEFFKMGQMNNFKAALRFENSMTADADVLKSTIEGVVIHNSAGWGISVKNSQNISFKNVDVFSVEQIGASFDATTKVSADSLNVYGVGQRGVISDNQVDKEACWAMCSFTESTACFSTTVINSIVAGCPYAGFIAPGYSCADPVGASTSNVFKNNVAHSVKGCGAAIYPAPGLADAKTCFQASHFAAYKNTQASIGNMETSDKQIISNLISIDNTKGIALNLSGETDIEKTIILKNSHVYGENTDLAKDCPDGPTGSATGANCYCVDKEGHMTSGAYRHDKKPHNPIQSARPVYKIKSYHTWNFKATTESTTFYNFKSEFTSCNMRQSVFAVNQYGSDLVPQHYFNNISFMNVKYNALAYIFDPPQGWAVIDDCGEWPCTAPSNVVYTFTKALFGVNDGVTQLPIWGSLAQSFQIVSDFATVASSYPNCIKVATWNAWSCYDPAQLLPPQIGQLVFESLDYDTEDRSVQPVVITNDKDGYRNVLNSMMDHTWDGFYTGQLHLSRFPAQILADRAYTITYTGTPFKNARYHLRTDAATKGILIKIPYPNAGCYSVQVNGSIVPFQQMDPVTMKPKPIDVATAQCGANLYVGVENYLQFFITPGCTAYVLPRDAILTSIRLEWTAAEFFAGDGATTFTQRLGAVLGVDATRVKIVSVYEGSVNVEVQILAKVMDMLTQSNGSMSSSAATYADLVQIQSLLNTLVSGASASVLGAKVLEVQGKLSSLYTQSGVVTPTAMVNQFGQPVASVPTGGLVRIALSLSVIMFASFSVVF